MALDKEFIREQMFSLQDDICFQLEELDKKGTFTQDLWEREEGGGGRSRVIQGQHIEKGGVNVSAVHGPMPKKIANALQLDQSDFFATGVSIVLHPRNPYVPIIHMNVRYFELSTGTYWFGGGIDLTPHYIDKREAAHFHLRLKELCDAYDSSFYPRFKAWADNYFYISHRKETRGIGGIFFDRLDHRKENLSKEKLFSFVLDVGNSFIPLYSPLLQDNSERPFTEREKEWQYVRRGRYVEFNLVLDRGTKFGLDTGGRTESILMSMPPFAEWKYNYKPEEGSAEANTQLLLRKGINYIDLVTA